MPSGRLALPIELTEVEENKLRLIASRPKAAQRDAQRAKIILKAAEGGTNKDIAQELGVDVTTVGKWRGRFALDRLDGLVDAPRSGKPRSIPDQKVEEVVTERVG